ncbi:MAG TPA: hypothetical protein VJM08_01425, partial [Anaerolineales bacterium]|nr:hypothetical protein [Anaerolineales bacterium]
SISFSGKVRVTIPYDPDMLPEGASESDIKLLHLDGSKWEDETLNVDSGSNTVTGEVSTFSPVVAGIEVPEEEEGDGDDGQGSNGGGTGGGSGGGSAGGSSGGISQPANQKVETPTVNLDKKLVTVGTNVEIDLLANLTAGIVRVNFANVSSQGEVGLNLRSISQFDDYFADVSDSNGTTTVENSKFQAFGGIYNLTGSANLRFVGDLEFAVSYNATELQHLQGTLQGKAQERNVRLLQLTGNASWQDITSSLATGSNVVRGISIELGPIVAAIVEDGTFGSHYLDRNPLSNMELTNVTVNHVGETFFISVDIQNLERTSQDYVIIAQIVDDHGQAVHIELEQQPAILPGAGAEAAFSWQSDDDIQNYSITLMIVSDLASPQLLGSPYHAAI